MVVDDRAAATGVHRAIWATGILSIDLMLRSS